MPIDSLTAKYAKKKELDAVVYCKILSDFRHVPWSNFGWRNAQKIRRGARSSENTTETPFGCCNVP